MLDECLESVATTEPLALRPAPELAADFEPQSMELIRKVNGPAPSQEIVDGLATLTKSSRQSLGSVAPEQMPVMVAWARA